MDFMDNFKSGAKLCADAATDAAQALVEKTRLKAQANRIKQIIKSDSQLRNQAYIELGRYFYENCREDASEECESLCEVIDKTTTRIDKASRKYLELISNSSDIKYCGESSEKIKKNLTQNAEKLKDATGEKVDAIKDKAKTTAQNISTKAKLKSQDLSDKAKGTVADLSDKAKETVADLSDKAKDKLDDFKAFIGPDEDIEELFDNDDIIEDVKTETEEIPQEPRETKETTPVADTVLTDDEESPEEFEF